MVRGRVVEQTLQHIDRFGDLSERLGEGARDAELEFALPVNAMDSLDAVGPLAIELLRARDTDVVLDAATGEDGGVWVAGLSGDGARPFLVKVTGVAPAEH